MMDGCDWRVGTPRGPTQALAAWVMAKRVWQIGSEITMGLAPLCPCLLLFLVAHSFWKCSHKHTHTYTRIHTFMPLHKDTPLGFPLICWTWRLAQELAIEKPGPSFMHLTLVVRSIVKVINMEGEDQPLLFPLCAITPTVSSKHLL